MADIHGTSGNDTYDQGSTPGNDWFDYYGEAGNDTIRMFQGQAIGGPGNDLIERKASADWWRQLGVAYWDAPAGVVVDLAAGWAQDGWGTTDTLIGVNHVNTGWWNDQVWGNAADNRFSSGSGHDTFDGRGGVDTLILPWVRPNAPGTWDDFVVTVSTDGRHVTITSPLDPRLLLELTDIEYIATNWDQPTVDVGSFIDPFDMAEEALVGTEAQRWNAAMPMGSAVTVTFSFVESAPASGTGASGFRAFTSAERAVVRDILKAVSDVTGIAFTETQDAGGGGQMRFGVSQQAATKGVAHAPGTSSDAGDIWMDVESMVSLAIGSEGRAALMHEIGHALGLRHPRNVDAGDAWAQQWRASDDSTSYSVMSQVASPDGLFRSDWGAMDVAALRHLYGSEAVNTGNNVHELVDGDVEGQTSVIDDGGYDTVDASASTLGVSIDLTPGHRSSVGVTAQGLVAVDNITLGLDTWIEAAIGSAHDDVLVGNSLANRLTGDLGNDWLDGGDGIDVAVFAGDRADYEPSSAFGFFYLTAADGQSGFDTLINVERLAFDDVNVALDVDGDAGTVAKVIGAVFGAAAVDNTAYVGIGLGLLDGGMSDEALAALALGVMVPGLGHQAVVQLVYTNVVGFAPSADQLALFKGMLDSGAMTPAGLVIMASNTSLNLEKIGFAELLLEGIAYT